MVPGAIEVYDRTRFFVVTGQVWDEARIAIEEFPLEVAELYAELKLLESREESTEVSTKRDMSSVSPSGDTKNVSGNRDTSDRQRRDCQDRERRQSPGTVAGRNDGRKPVASRLRLAQSSGVLLRPGPARPGQAAILRPQPLACEPKQPERLDYLLIAPLPRSMKPEAGSMTGRRPGRRPGRAPLRLRLRQQRQARATQL